jgi:hypothetical protein
MKRTTVKRHTRRTPTKKTTVKKHIRSIWDDDEIHRSGKERTCAVHGKEHKYGGHWEYDEYDPRTGLHKAITCSATEREVKYGEYEDTD